MASHFKWYPADSETVVPWNARYAFPSQANKSEKITPRIPPKSGSNFNPTQVIRVEFPAQGYVNAANTFLEFDVTLRGYQGTGTEEQEVDGSTLAAANSNLQGAGTGQQQSQTVRFENNIASIFQRIRLLYGATPLEDLIDSNIIVRELTEWTSGGSTLDQNSLREGIGGVVYNEIKNEVYTAGAGDIAASAPVYNTVGGMVNVRQAYIQGIDTRQNVTLSGSTQIIGQGFGVVPNQSAGQSTLTGDTYNVTVTEDTNTYSYAYKTICTRRYQIQFPLGLFTQDKLIPTKYMASQLAIELTLAPEAQCIFVEKAPNTLTGLTTPTYQVSNVNLIPEILQFDSSYDAMFLRGLREGGVPIKFSSWHTFSYPAGSTTLQMLIQERSRSVKALFAVQRRSTPSLLSDSGACFFDTAAISTPSTLQSYQYRIGGRYFPAAPVQCAINLGQSTPNGGAEAYAELEKALNIVGDYRLNTANNSTRWASTLGIVNGKSPTSGDYAVPFPGYGSGGQLNGSSASLAAPFNGAVGSSCFAMATSLETSNGLEISGLNAEEQSDISLLANWQASQNITNIIEVFTYYDAMLVLRESNSFNHRQHPRIDSVIKSTFNSMKLTRKLVKYYMKDEKKASKAYAKLKLKKLAHDEKRHFRFFKRLLKK